MTHVKAAKTPLEFVSICFNQGYRAPSAQDEIDDFIGDPNAVEMTGNSEGVK